MALRTAIEWTDSTWNPVTGCSKVSPGCAHCYAERLAKRLRAMGNPSYTAGFEVTLHESALDLPNRWRNPQNIFVNSMSDLFHPLVPVSFIKRVFDTMLSARQHRFQILTKRSERLLELQAQLPWAPNIWMGVSVESQDYLYRVKNLRETGAQVKFISFEPLLGPVREPDLTGIHWAIVGGESGPGARPMDQSWVIGLRDACRAAGTPFFFKQWGGQRRKRAGRELEGRTWDELPATLDGRRRDNQNRFREGAIT